MTESSQGLKNISVDCDMNRIEIDSLDIRGIYSIKEGELTNDKCTLCRQLLMFPSFDNLKNGNLNVKITIGKCNHAFHTKCINAHNKNSFSCPIDKTPWSIKETYNILQ